MNAATKSLASGVSTNGIGDAHVRDMLERHLRAPGGPPVEVVECKPSFTRDRESRSLFQYDVTLRDPDGREWQEAVSGVAYGRDRTRKAWEQLDLGDEAVGPGRKIRRASYVPDLDLLLQVFPFDHRLPALERLMAGPLVGLEDPVMAQFGPGDWHVDNWQSESIRYRVDLRASVKLTVRATEARLGREAEKGFYAKVYARQNQVERALNVQQDLAVALESASDPFGLASLVAYLPKARVLVQEEVQAVSLQAILRRGDPDDAAVSIRRAARAIAALHRLSITAPEHRGELDRTDRGRLHRIAEALRTSRPDLARAVTEIEGQIHAGLDAAGDLSVPIHGDMKPGHLLLDKERVVVVDLDKFAAGEPMVDVTNILGPIGRERQTGAAGNCLAREFTDEYFAHVPTAWQQRLAPFRAWALLKELSSVSTSHAKRPRGDKARRPEKGERNGDFLIEEARAVLAGRA